jgi:hypothetical protein
MAVVWRLLEDRRLVPIGALGRLAGRRVRVAGRVVAHEDQLLTAPLTGTRCVAYTTRVRHWYSTVWSEHVEEEVWVRTEVIRFVLEDVTGRVPVDPATYAADLVLPEIVAIGQAKPASAELTEIVRGLRSSDGGVVSEIAVRPGDTLTVAGVVIEIPARTGTSVDFRTAPMGPALVGRGREDPLLLSNLPRLMC